jgi:DNA-binding transcriptional LysR family regulator
VRRHAQVLVGRRYIRASTKAQAALHDGERVRVHDAGANEVLDAVARGEADFGLNFIGSQEPDIEFRSLLEERFVAACRRDHPLAKLRQVTWGELAGHDFINVAKSSGNRLLLDQAWRGGRRACTKRSM